MTKFEKGDLICLHQNPDRQSLHARGMAYGPYVVLGYKYVGGKQLVTIAIEFRDGSTRLRLIDAASFFLFERPIKSNWAKEGF